MKNTFNKNGKTLKNKKDEDHGRRKVLGKKTPVEFTLQGKCQVLGGKARKAAREMVLELSEEVWIRHQEEEEDSSHRGMRSPMCTQRARQG